MSSDAPTITKLYEQIPLEAMQQVADSYMTWYVEKTTRQLDEAIAQLRAELEENDKQEALFKPSAAELDALRRLQSNKVADIDLLDRLVERGEEWLVLTMHRLDYFERAGLAPTDYPAWCEHALIGAYDWIDAARLHASKRMFSLQGGGTGPMRAVRPSDLAAINAVKTAETTNPQRAEPAASTGPLRPPTQPQRSEPAVSRPIPPARTQEVAEHATQPVPAIAQPTPGAPEQIARLETAPLSAPPPRPEAPRASAPAVQATPRPAAPPAQSIPEAATRPTPVATATHDAPAPPRPAPAAHPTGTASTGQPAQRRPDQQTPPARPQPSQPINTPPAAAPAYVAQKPRPSSNWGSVQDQRPDPRYSLDDVEVEDLEEEGEDQGLLRKIFRVFTG